MENERTARRFAPRRDPAHPDTYQDSLQLAKREWGNVDPGSVEWRADVQRRQPGRTPEEFVVPYFGRPFVVTWPSGDVRELESGKPASEITQIVVLHYLLTADGSPLNGEWVSFRQVPDGMVYFAAFHGRSEQPLAQHFGSDLDGFARAAEALGGERWRMADVSFGFRAFPRLPLAVLLWGADDEFPASASILFDAAVGHYLPTEDVSGIGATICNRLLRWKP